MVHGCIKMTKGPWAVRRSGKDGKDKRSWRHPSEREREHNRQRESRRRKVTANIFEGLRRHGNYKLPRHPDRNDILKALCEEAGWLVNDDGTISRKPPSEVATFGSPISSQGEMKKELKEVELELTLALPSAY